MASATPDLRLSSQSQNIATPRLVPNYTAWWQRHMCLNNLPKGVTWQRFGRELNSQLLESQANALAITPPGHYRISIIDCRFCMWSFYVFVYIRGMIKRFFGSSSLTLCTVCDYGNTLRYNAILLLLFFYRATLCQHGTCYDTVSIRLSVCLSVCLSQVGVRPKRLNVWSLKQHLRHQGL